MSLHLGLHWNMILGMFRKAAGIKSKAKSRSMMAFVIGLVIAGYGLCALIGRDFPTYLFLKSEFVFLDSELSIKQISICRDDRIIILE